MIRKRQSGKSTGEKASRSNKIAKLGVLIVTLWIVASLPAMGVASSPNHHDQSQPAVTFQSSDNGIETSTEFVVSGGSNGTLKRTDPVTGNGTWSYEFGSGYNIDEVEPSPDNDVIFAGGSVGEFVAAHDSQSGERLWITEGETIGFNDLAPSWDGEAIYSADGGNNIIKYHSSNGSVIWRRTVSDSATSVETHPNGDLVFAGTNGGELLALSPQTGQIQWTVQTGDYPYTIDVSSGGNSLYLQNQFDSSVMKVDVSGETVEWENTDVSNTQSLTLSSDESDVFVSNTSGGIYRIASSNGTILDEFDVTTEEIFDLSPAVDDGALYASYGTPNEPELPGGIIAIDMESGAEYWSVENHDGQARSLTTDGSYQLVSESISGTVTDQDGNPIENASIEIGDGFLSTETDASGDFSLGVTEGTHTVEISHPRYRTYVDDRVQAGEHMGVIQLEPKRLEIDVPSRMEPNSDRTYPYQVWWWDDDGKRNEVTSNAEVTSNNTTIATVDDFNFQIIPQDGVNATVDITATYNGPDGETYNATVEVAVAEATVENLPLLPAAWRISALLGNSQIQTILVATFAGIIGTWFATSFAGLGAFQLIMVVGWFGDYVEIGIVMLSLFTALFIGFNLAANIDYTVRR